MKPSVKAVSLRVNILTQNRTNSMQQSHSWEANKSSAGRETPRILFITAFTRAHQLSLSWTRYQSKSEAFVKGS